MYLKLNAEGVDLAELRVGVEVADQQWGETWLYSGQGESKFCCAKLYYSARVFYDNDYASVFQQAGQEEHVL